GKMTREAKPKAKAPAMRTMKPVKMPTETPAKRRTTAAMAKATAKRRTGTPTDRRTLRTTAAMGTAARKMRTAMGRPAAAMTKATATRRKTAAIPKPEAASDGRDRMKKPAAEPGKNGSAAGFPFHGGASGHRQAGPGLPAEQRLQRGHFRFGGRPHALRVGFRIFRVGVPADRPVGRIDPFARRAGTEPDDGLHFFHDDDVVQAFPAGQAVAHVF